MHALLPLFLLAGCAVSEPPAEAPSANGAMWGTDAHLAPSKPDAVLRYADHPRGFAELRVPAGKGPFPLAVIFHGGCFKTGIADTAYMRPLATRWQQQGIATLDVDYREVGDEGGWPGSFADWDASAALIDRVAAKYPIDRTRVTLAGHSAGVTAALWLASASGVEGPLGVRRATRARAVLALDGVGNLGREQPAFDALCQFSSVAPFVGEGARRYDALRAAPEVRDVLFVQAKLPAPPAASRSELESRGATVAVREDPGASHFAIITPGDPVYEANEPTMLRLLRGE